MQIDQKILTEYLSDAFDVDRDDLEFDASLFAEGLLDSFNLLELISHLESLSEVRIKPLEINLENFDTIERILAFIDRRVA